MALAQATDLLNKFKAAVAKGDVASADSLLGQLKLKLIQLPALPPIFGESPTAQQELLLGREALEQAALYALRRKDEGAAERAFAQLRTFYEDTRSLLPASPSEPSMSGLSLLRLLVANRIAEFHTQLETIPPEAQADPAIAQAVQLEQWLMEGAYNKVLGASKTSASDVHAALLSQLANTVRDEAASCAERAYERLPLGAAARLLMFDSEAALKEYAAEHSWTVADGYILFKQPAGAANAPAGAAAPAAGGRCGPLPSLELINNALLYAKELERIV